MEGAAFRHIHLNHTNTPTTTTSNQISRVAPITHTLGFKVRSRVLNLQLTLTHAYRINSERAYLEDGRWSLPWGWTHPRCTHPPTSTSTSTSTAHAIDRRRQPITPSLHHPDFAADRPTRQPTQTSSHKPSHPTSRSTGYNTTTTTRWAGLRSPIPLRTNVLQISAP